jgi:CheY-like chemotaxis protein
MTAHVDAPAMGKRPLVLVIDDDAEIRTTIQSLLDAEGVATVGAADGQAAFHLLADLRVWPALILLDLIMPIVDRLDVLQDPSRDRDTDGDPRHHDQRRILDGDECTVAGRRKP